MKAFSVLVSTRFQGSMKRTLAPVALVLNRLHPVECVNLVKGFAVNTKSPIKERRFQKTESKDRRQISRRYKKQRIGLKKATASSMTSLSDANKGALLRSFMSVSYGP